MHQSEVWGRGGNPASPIILSGCVATPSPLTFVDRVHLRLGCAGQWCQEDFQLQEHCWKSSERVAGSAESRQGPDVGLQVQSRRWMLDGHVGWASCPAAWDLHLGDDCEKAFIRDCQESALLLCCRVLNPTFLQALSSLAMKIHSPKPLISLP